jgi:hypothetical protein
MNEEKNPRLSERVSGHVIYLTKGFRKNPICPHHGKRAIICELPDELRRRRWYCIDCIARAIYVKGDEGNE